MRLFKYSRFVIICILCFSQQVFAESAIAPSLSVNVIAKDDLRLLTEVFHRIKSEFIDPIDNQQLINQCLLRIDPSYTKILPSPFVGDTTARAAINLIGQFINIKTRDSAEAHEYAISCLKGMADSLNSRSYFMSADNFKALQDTNSAGIGIKFKAKSENQKLLVLSVTQGGPAQQAGIQFGDAITAINKQPTDKLNSIAIFELLRGSIGSSIELTIERKSENKPLKLTVYRAIVKEENVQSKLLEKDYGYIQISRLMYETGSSLAQNLHQLYEENQSALKGIVLDLRNNQGGLLTASNAVVAPFLPENSLVFYTTSRQSDANKRFTTNPLDFLRPYTGGEKNYTRSFLPEYKTVPLAVLINKGSYGGAEIIAGALQDYKRAIIVGESSYSGGSIETVFPGGYGTGLKLTTAYWYTPKNRTVKSTGIIPNVITDESGLFEIGSDNDITLIRALELLK